MNYMDPNKVPTIINMYVPNDYNLWIVVCGVQQSEQRKIKYNKNNNKKF